MQTVFSHIVQKSLSQQSENVATVALEFILTSSEPARNGMMKLLRGVVPQLPRLWFRTQQMEDNNRPDMWGNDDEAKPHVFVENKFWAGLTDKQPVSYLKILAKQNHPTVLLVVVPEAREKTVWRELKRRVDAAGISATEKDPIVGILRNIKTRIGPILALTSWTRLLNFLELEVSDDKSAKSDLLQLKALCEAVESDAFMPFSSEDVSDQRTPGLILQLTSVVQEATSQAFSESALTKGKRLAPSGDSSRNGIYANILADGRCGLWFGVHFGLWKKYGITPLWVFFSTTTWGRAAEVRALLEPWATKKGVFVASEPNGYFVVAFDLLLGEEENLVIRGIVDRFKEIGKALSVLKPRASGDTEPKEDFADRVEKE
jgi:hypothetical protein